MFVKDIAEMPPCCKEFYEKRIADFEKSIQQLEKIAEIEVMRSVKEKLKTLYKELEGEGIPERYVDLIFSQMVIFTEENKSKIKISKAETVVNLSAEFFLEKKDVIFVLKYFSIANARILQIVRILIGFTLDCLEVN